MQCPICGRHDSVGKLYEVIRSRKVISSFFCNACAVEFRTREQEVLTICKVKANGVLKKIC